MNNVSYAVPVGGSHHVLSSSILSVRTEKVRHFVSMDKLNSPLRMSGIAHTPVSSAINVGTTALLRSSLQTFTSVTKFPSGFSQSAASSTNKLAVTNGNNK